MAKTESYLTDDDRKILRKAAAVRALARILCEWNQVQDGGGISHMTIPSKEPLQSGYHPYLSLPGSSRDEDEVKEVIAEIMRREVARIVDEIVFKLRAIADGRE